MKFILGVVAGAILVPLVAVAYLLSGYAPVAVADAPMPFEARIAGMALQERIQKEAPVRDLSGMSTPDLLAGADIYKKNCAECHGLPDQTPAIADNMFPQVPQLMKPPKGRGGAGGPQGGPRPGGEAARGPRTPRPNGDFWRVKNGIRLTGMPSFQNVLSEDQMWQVTGLIANRRRLPPEVQDALKSDAAASAVVTPAPAAPPAKPKVPN
jgi:mono/diheme cytochrome c family protein